MKIRLNYPRLVLFTCWECTGKKNQYFSCYVWSLSLRMSWRPAHFFVQMRSVHLLRMNQMVKIDSFWILFMYVTKLITKEINRESYELRGMLLINRHCK
jgi:hypothetical protein